MPCLFLQTEGRANEVSTAKTILGVIITFSILAGCGGGGDTGTSSSGGGNPVPAKTLTWVAPVSYTDGTPLDPATELDSFEVYVRASGSFAESDTPLALVGAVDPLTGQISTSFNLANLGPFITPGIQYQVALRAVAITGAKSGFSGTALFSF